MTDDEVQEISDRSDLRKYRIELPNMADDEMGPFEFRLYGHYKRVCGTDGVCWENIRTTSEKTRMSVGQVSNSRKILEADGWIRVGTNPRTGTLSVLIVDRWPENFQRFAGVHQVNSECSPPEQECSPGELKKELYKNKPAGKKKRTPSSEFPGGRFLSGKYADEINH